LSDHRKILAKRGCDDEGGRPRAEPFQKTAPETFCPTAHMATRGLARAIIRGALASDDALTGLGEEPRFRVRATPDWKQHAADLEAEMLKRGMMFDVIDWSED
jgi:hypothetical protein